MLLITHDISLVFESCDGMAVMHSGQAAETGSVVELFDDPRHPYLILLQKAFPDVRYPDRELGTIEGNPPQLHEEPEFCTFVERCPWAVEECREFAPKLDPVEVRGTETSETKAKPHNAACFRKDEVYRLLDSGSGATQVESVTEDVDD